MKTHNAAFFTIVLLLFLSCSGSLHALWPLPHPILVDGVVSVEKGKLLLDGRSLSVFGPFKRILPLCRGRRIFMSGHVLEDLDSSGGDDRLFFIQRIWVDEATPDQGPVYLDGPIIGGADGVFSVDSREFKASGGLACALSACTDIDEQFSLIAVRGKKGDVSLDIRSIGVMFYYANDGAPHNTAASALEIYRQGHENAFVKSVAVSEKEKISVVTVASKQLQDDPVAYYFDGDGSLLKALVK